MLEILFIEKYLNRNDKKYLVILTKLPLLLINFHSGVIYFYFIIMGTYLFNAFHIHFGRLLSDKRIKSKQVRALMLSSFAGAFLTTLNPYGISGITYGLKTVNSYYINNYITEFQPFNLFTPMGTITAFYVSICVFALLFSKRKIKIHELLLLGGTMFMAFLSTRHFSLLVITSVVILPHIEGVYERIDNSNWDLVKSFKKGINLMNVIVIVLYVIMFIYISSFIITRETNPLPKNQYPIDALKYIKKNIPNARIFNYYQWGSYMIIENVKTFIDPRCDLFNAEYNKNTSVMKDYIEATNNMKNYTYVVSKYNIDYFLLNKRAKLSNKIIEDDKYKVVYTDDIAVIIKVIK
jgi:hypothetical protein